MLARSFFIRIAGEVQGPLSSDDLRNLARTGVLTPSDEVRDANSSEWRLALNLVGLWPVQRPTAMSPEKRPPKVAKPPKLPGPPPIPVTMGAASPEDAPANPLSTAHKVLLWLLITYIGALFMYPVVVILIPLQVIAQWRVNRQLGWTPLAVGLAVIGTLIPFVGAISLLVSEEAARDRLREQGLTVGLLGVVSESQRVTVLTVVKLIGLWMWCLALVTIVVHFAYEYFTGQVPKERAVVPLWTMLFIWKSFQIAVDESVAFYERINRAGR